PSRSGVTTSGYCATRGATSSACSNRTSPSCSPGVVLGAVRLWPKGNPGLREPRSRPGPGDLQQHDGAALLADQVDDQAPAAERQHPILRWVAGPVGAALPRVSAELLDRRVQRPGGL